MFTITKKERDYLESQGCKFGDQLHKSRGTSKHCTYFATETKYVFDLLEQYYTGLKENNKDNK